MPRWISFAIAIAVLYFLAANPTVLGTLLGIVIVIGEIVAILFGFAFFLEYNELWPPIWAGAIGIVLCFIWPSLLGVIVGLGVVGFLTFVALATMGHFDS